MSQNRREFLKATAATSFAISSGLSLAYGQEETPKSEEADPSEELFKISLAQWSIHKAIGAGKIKAWEFAEFAKEKCGIDAIELVNTFHRNSMKNKKYIGDLSKRAQDVGVEHILIMCDGEGKIGDPDKSARTKTVDNHKKWVEAARDLGCHAIRVNAQSDGSAEEQRKLVADGLHQLGAFAKDIGINVIVENHGGLSSRGRWLADTIKAAKLPNVGTLPDFGNFENYDRYKGVEEMMEFAKGVSAKSYDFDKNGNETKINYDKMLRVVMAGNYHGRIGIEYEGSRLSELDGILATKKLLIKIRKKLVNENASNESRKFGK